MDSFFVGAALIVSAAVLLLVAMWTWALFGMSEEVGKAFAVTVFVFVAAGLFTMIGNS